jgi:hypothetical protein
MLLLSISGSSLTTFRSSSSDIGCFLFSEKACGGYLLRSTAISSTSSNHWVRILLVNTPIHYLLRADRRLSMTTYF